MLERLPLDSHKRAGLWSRHQSGIRLSLLVPWSLHGVGGAAGSLVSRERTRGTHQVMRETSQENNGSGTGLRRFVLAGAAALALIAAAASTAQAAGPAPGPRGRQPCGHRAR